MKPHEQPVDFTSSARATDNDFRKAPDNVSDGPRTLFKVRTYNQAVRLLSVSSRQQFQRAEVQLSAKARAPSVSWTSGQAYPAVTATKSRFSSFRTRQQLALVMLGLLSKQQQ